VLLAQNRAELSKLVNLEDELDAMHPHPPPQPQPAVSRTSDHGDLKEFQAEVNAALRREQAQAGGPELASPLQAGQQPATPARGREAQVEEEARVLEVLVETGRHLPKMDTLGKCDGFCEIKWRDFVEVTQVKKNTYSPDWNERFEFEFAGEVTGDLVLTLKDWDRFSSPDLVGQVSIPPAQIEEMARRGGRVAQALDVLTAQGRPVIGHDKSPCVIAVKLALRSAAGARGAEQEREEAEAEAQEPAVAPARTAAASQEEQGVRMISMPTTAPTFVLGPSQPRSPSLPPSCQASPVPAASRSLTTPLSRRRQTYLKQVKLIIQSDQLAQLCAILS
jgi:hypothetical protein